MKYQGKSLQEAADEVIMNKLKQISGTGGIIGVDNKGNVSMTFNSSGMFRGYVKANGEMKVAMFGR